MDSRTSDLDVNQVAGNGDDGAVPLSPSDAAQPAGASGIQPERLGLEQELAARSRRNGRRSMLFVLVLTGAVMVFAVIVAIWMYWLAPALAV